MPQTAPAAGWGDWGGPYNENGNWLWKIYYDGIGPSCNPGRRSCPIVLLWLESESASGYRVYVAPSTDTEWICHYARRAPTFQVDSSLLYCTPVQLRCATSEQQLLVEVDSSTHMVEVIVKREWAAQKWCVILTAFNDAGESEPNANFLEFDAR